MKDYVKMPNVNVGALQNVEETEEYAKTVTEKQKRI
jgi:hypothetical protein